MAVFSLAPAYLKMLYTGASGIHTHLIPVQGNGIGGQFDVGNIRVTLNDGTTQPVQTALEAYAVVFAGQLGTGSSIYAYEVYNQVDEDALPILIAEGALAQAAPLAQPVVLGNQASVSWRTSLGGKARTVFLDVPYTEDQVYNGSVNVPSASVTAFYAFMLGDSGFVRGRDGGKLTVARRLITKRNDALRRKNIGI